MVVAKSIENRFFPQFGKNVMDFSCSYPNFLNAPQKLDSLGIEHKTFELSGVRVCENILGRWII